MTDHLDLDLGRESWKALGLCRQADPDAFFPDKGGNPGEAKRICVRCEVREECLQYALEHDERYGIWGGLSERERRKLRRGEPPRNARADVPRRAPSPETTNPTTDEPSQRSARRAPAGSRAARGTSHRAGTRRAA